MKITVDRDRCVGAGNCVLAADGIFEQDETDGRVVLLRSEPPQDLVPQAQDAEHMCPSRAISIDPS